MSALIIAQLTVLEAVRRKLILVGAIISLVFIALYAIGFSFLYANSPANGGQAALVGAITFLTVLGHVCGQFSLVVPVAVPDGGLDIWRDRQRDNSGNPRPSAETVRVHRWSMARICQNHHLYVAHHGVRAPGRGPRNCRL